MDLELEGERLQKVRVLRGAPCGATWEAAERIRGLSVEEALARIGLETQFHCIADPSGWDPLWGKSPVHFAADVHKAALERAVSRLKIRNRRCGSCPGPRSRT
jgi:hypothetical protein